MLARDLMTTDVVTVSPDIPVREIARLLVKHGISAVPVVDASGMPIGMVSEGDLIGRDDVDRQARRDWWLTLLAEGEELHPDFLNTLRNPEHTAREVMAAPVVRVTEDTDAGEIARLLQTYRIKRVPVVREGRIVGIISRGDLLRAMADEPGEHERRREQARQQGLFGNVMAAIDRRFDSMVHHGAGPAAEITAPRHPAAALNGASEFSAQAFRGLVASLEQQKEERRDKARRDAVEHRREQVRELIATHYDDARWRSLLTQAQHAAAHGEKEFMLLSFPSNLCTDGGRAINALLAEWPETLRGEAAEIYLRWETELKPRGFHLTARVLDFPSGMPGDIGLFLVWDI